MPPLESSWSLQESPPADLLLLLMEAMQEGSYRRAIEKRGPGLHHIAVDVLNIEDYLRELSGSGWASFGWLVPK